MLMRPNISLEVATGLASPPRPEMACFACTGPGMRFTGRQAGGWSK